MKELLILRHAKSSWKDVNLSDHDRPLNKRGKRDAPYMGSFLQTKGLVPDAVICSSAKRARKTAKLALKECSFQGRLTITPSLYHASPKKYLENLEDLDGKLKRAMVVGHNPGLEDLITRLTGEEPQLPTAALARICLDIDHWNQIKRVRNAKLADLWRPKELQAAP